MFEDISHEFVVKRHLPCFEMTADIVRERCTYRHAECNHRVRAKGFHADMVSNAWVGSCRPCSDFAVGDRDSENPHAQAKKREQSKDLHSGVKFERRIAFY